MSIFDFMDMLNGTEKRELHIDKPIRLIELFAGYGSQAMALRNIGANFEHYKISEWCIPSVNMYHAIHCNGKYEKCDYEKDAAVRILLDYGVSIDGKQPLTEDNLKRKSVEWLNDVIAKFRASNNLGSITNFHGKDLEIVDTDRYSYLLTYSFPCQDLSVAGKGKGMTKGSGTRSGLLWEVERLLSETENLPQILLMENVPQVHSSANLPDFKKWLDFLESKGYSNFYQDLNARNYGVAQNRNRCFCVSILGEAKYTFPEPIELTKNMKDYLEETVDKKYYITTDKARDLIEKLILNGSLGDLDKYKNPKGIYKPFDGAISYPLHSQDFVRTGFQTECPTLASRDYKDPKITCEIKCLGFVEGENGRFIQHQSNSVYDPNGLSPCIYSGCDKDPTRIADIKRLGNLYGENKGTGFAGNVWDSNGICPTLTTMSGGAENL